MKKDSESTKNEVLQNKKKDKESITLEFAKRIQFIRKDILKLSQQGMAENINFGDRGQVIIWGFEKGNGSAANIFTLLRYLHSVGINLNYIFAENPQDIDPVQINKTKEDPILVKAIGDKYQEIVDSLLNTKVIVGNNLDSNITEIINHLKQLGIDREIEL